MQPEIALPLAILGVTLTFFAGAYVWARHKDRNHHSGK